MIRHYLVRYEREVDGDGRISRRAIVDRPAVRDQLRANNAVWRAFSIGGPTPTVISDGWAIVQLDAQEGVHTQFSSLSSVRELPRGVLGKTLGDLTAMQRQTLLSWFVDDLGFPQDEVTAALGANWNLITLRAVIRYIITNTREVRFDNIADRWLHDGSLRPVGRIEAFDPPLLLTDPPTDDPVVLVGSTFPPPPAPVARPPDDPLAPGEVE